MKRLKKVKDWKKARKLVRKVLKAIKDRKRVRIDIRQMKVVEIEE